MICTQSLFTLGIIYTWFAVAGCKEGEGDGKDVDGNYNGDHGTDNDFICGTYVLGILAPALVAILSGGIWLVSAIYKKN
jgi:hypothetical protein